MTLYAVYLCPCSSRTLSRRRSLVAVMVQHPSADLARNARYPTPRSVTRFSLPSPLEHSIIATTRTVCTCSCVLESQWPLLLFCCRHRQRHRRAGGHASAQVLSEVEAVAVWKKLILQHDKAPVVANVMEYLTDRVDGRPRRPSRQSGTVRHDSIAVGHHAGMAAIGYRQSAGESHYPRQRIVPRRSGHCSSVASPHYQGKPSVTV